MVAMKKKIPQEIDNPSSSSSSNRFSRELVTQSDFIFRNPSASLNDTKKFLDSVFENFKRANELHFSTISTFTLDFPFRSQLATSSVTGLVHLALQFKVKELNLILTNGDLDEYLSDPDVGRSFDLFQLPDILNDDKFLTKMNLGMCSFNEIGEIVKWDSLKHLRLTHTCLDRIDRIVEGCPVLEVLELCECWGFKTLDFENHKMLKKFVLDGVWPKYEEQFDFLTISVPSVQVLEIGGKLDLRNVILKNISGCVNVDIDFYWTSGEHGQTLENGGFSVLILQKILENLKDVQYLTFGTWFIEIISRKLYDTDFTFELTKCKGLRFHAPVDGRYQRGMLLILESCSNVETLIIQAARSYPSCKICPNEICIHDINTSTNEVSPSDSEVQRNFAFKILRFYKIDDEAGTSNNISGEAAKSNNIGDLPVFVKFLIKNSRRLQKVLLK